MRIMRSPNTFAVLHIPIIMLTGHKERERVEAVRLGVNEFLSKPVSAKLLHQRIMSIRGNPRPMVLIGDDYRAESRKVKSSAWQSVDSYEPVWI
jgi:two-component system chemotaxis response regulator CheY